MVTIKITHHKCKKPVFHECENLKEANNLLEFLEVTKVLKSEKFEIILTKS